MEANNRTDRPETVVTELAATVAAGKATQAQIRDLTDWVEDLVARAEIGDREALRQAITLCEADPILWPTANILQHTAERSVLDATVGTDRQLYSRAAVERHMADLRREIAGAYPTPLERLLVDQVVLCWLQALFAVVSLAQRQQTGYSHWQGEYDQRRAERTQRQYLRAIKTLATVRRLEAPVVQLNMAEQQINVAR